MSSDTRFRVKHTNHEAKSLPTPNDISLKIYGWTEATNNERLVVRHAIHSVTYCFLVLYSYTFMSLSVLADLSTTNVRRSTNCSCNSYAMSQSDWLTYDEAVFFLFADWFPAKTIASLQKINPRVLLTFSLRPFFLKWYSIVAGPKICSRRVLTVTE